MTLIQPLRVGIGGPVGSGKTALPLALGRALRDRYQLAVVTNLKSRQGLDIVVRFVIERRMVGATATATR